MYDTDAMYLVNEIQSSSTEYRSNLNIQDITCKCNNVMYVNLERPSNVLQNHIYMLYINLT